MKKKKKKKSTDIRHSPPLDGGGDMTSLLQLLLPWLLCSDGLKPETIIQKKPSWSCFCQKI